MAATLANIENLHKEVDKGNLLKANYEKLKVDFTPNTPKYVFKGIAEFAQEAPEIITGDNYESGIGVRDERTGTHMADGYARATGRVGVCMATSGPGATNLVTGIADAYLDSVPLVAITGNVSTPLIGSDAFQEADITGITMPITKHNWLVTDVKDLPRILKEAFYVARTGRPGPVLIDLPLDVQRELIVRRDWHERLLHGSDYPLPGIGLIYRLERFVDAGWLDAHDAAVLERIRPHNPLLFEFVLKRTLAVQDEIGCQRT